jgi:enterochelin esterase-like enzyme
MPDRFVDGENFAWISFKGGAHAYNCWLPDLYNSLLVFFTK